MSTKPIPTSMAATKIGISTSWARELCDRHGIGLKLTSRMRLLTGRDVAKLRRLVGKRKVSSRA